MMSGRRGRRVSRLRSREPRRTREKLERRRRVVEGRRRSKEAQQGRWDGKGSRLGGVWMDASLETLELLLELVDLDLMLDGHHVHIGQVHQG